MKNLDIYEVEYSCSPGGIDCWEISERDGDFFAISVHLALGFAANSNTVATA